ncbi:hypothetical protein F2Q68_00032413 [Brassica cretica]|uniref:Uncharacterized protein n=1 Tax=Brassica cretica TaxID=69181 RepID=A0A8S9G8M7_BRACR|nr:hypothetical protein F2Q68_00032413 [Brassica cretica]
MSFGGSHWCRPMSMDTHRSTDHNEDRSTDHSRHRSTSSAKSNADNRPTEKDRYRSTPSPPIDRRAPLTYRVRLPSIDNDRINALRPPPKPLANPPEPTTNPSDITPEPMQVDEATEGRKLRKKKEKIPKNLKRKANEKEMDGFTKSVLRIPVEKPFDEVNLVELGNDLGYIAACHCGAEYETEYSESIDTHTASSIDSNESPMTDEHYPTSLDGKQPIEHFTLPDQCYPDFAFQQPNKRGRDDYSIGSWANSRFHENFAVETVIPSSNEDPTEEYDEDYWKERAIDISIVYSASVDTHPHPAKRSYASINIIPGTLIDIKVVAFEKEKGNIPIPSRDPDGHARAMDGRILQVSREDIADILQVANGPDNLFMQQRNILNNISAVPDKYPRANTTEIGSHRSCKPVGQASIDMVAPTSLDRVTPMSLDKAPSPDRRYEFGHRAYDIYGARKFRWEQKDEYGVYRDESGYARSVAEIGSHQSCRPVGQASIDKVAPTSFDRVTPMSLDKAPSPSIDRRYEFGHRAYDIYGARKFRWEQKDEYGVYRDESGYARSVAGEMIPVTKGNIRKIMERASLFEESHICLPENATSFTPTKLAPEIYTKDEINEMETGICGAQEKLGDELKTLVDDTSQPLDRGYNELFRSMEKMRAEIESMQDNLEKEATTSPSIDANKATLIDVKPQTSQIPTETESLAEKKDEWEIAYINTRINDVYNPLNNNVDWLSTRIDLLQQDLDIIRKKDPQPATSIDICTITSIDSKFAAMEDRLQSYEDMHDRFTSPIMRYLDTLSTQMMNVQRDIGKLNDQHDFQEEGSTSIDRFRRASLDGKKPTEHLPYTAAEVDQITSKFYTAIDTMEERFEKRCDDIYFPFDVRLSGLDSQAEWLQKEVKAIQRQLASQHQISASIDKARSKSIESKALTSTDKHLVASIDTTSTPDDEQLIQNKMESMHEEMNELSAYAYDKI